MKREAKSLLEKAVDSLILAIEHFNRPSNVGRVSTVLILLDHAFEMLLKSAIITKGIKIRDRKESNRTIGFDKCLRIALTDAKAKFLSQEQVLSLQILNNLRDAAQHHLISVSEEQLYVHAQAAVTLFRDILDRVFKQSLVDRIPERILPISVKPPTDIATLFEREIKDVRMLLNPKSRRKAEAMSRLKPLAIVDAAVKGAPSIPTERELKVLSEKVLKNLSLNEVFSGIGSIDLSAKGYGPSLDLKFTKKDGIPIHIVPEGTPGAHVLSVKRVNELDFYSLGRDDLAKKLGISGPKVTCVISYSGITNDKECFSEVTISKSKFKRYSEKALERLREVLKEKSADEIWREVYPKKPPEE